MIKVIRHNFLSVIFLFIIFFEQIFICSLVITGTEVESGIKKYEAILLSIVIFGILVYNFCRGYIAKSDLRTIFIVFLLILLYYFTQFFYEGTPDGYISNLLVLGSECLPAAYVGSRLAPKGVSNLFSNTFSILIIIITFLLGTIGMKYATANELVRNDESGLNYQMMSYFMAFSFSYCLYLLFFNKFGASLFPKTLRYLIVACSAICFIFCVISGGRGGLYFMLLFSIVFMIICIKHHIVKFRSFILILIVLIFVLGALIYFFDAFNSAGLDRVFSRLTEHNSRSELFDLAIKSFSESPIFGNGLGSVWWTVGFYSHNIILDLLTEIGMIGLVTFLVITIKAIKKLMLSSESNKLSLLILFILFGDLFRLMFSGYWISTMHIFFCYSYAFALRIEMPQKNYSY